MMDDLDTYKNNNWPKTIGELREIINKYTDETPIHDIQVDGCYYDYYEIFIKTWGNGVALHISGGWD